MTRVAITGDLHMTASSGFEGVPSPQYIASYLDTYLALCPSMCNSFAPRREPPWLNFTPTLPPQAGILKAGAAVIECSLKAEYLLVPVMIGAAATQTFSLSTELSSSRRRLRLAASSPSAF